MVNRMVLRKDGSAVACELCGYESLRTAELVDGDGAVLGRTLVCTTCQARRREPGHTGPARAGDGHQGTAAGS